MELDLHPLRVLFESEVIAQSRDHTAAHDAHGGPTGEAQRLLGLRSTGL